MAAVPAYPVRVEGKLDAPLSRWLWLVKWLLVIPHYIVLAFLWIAFVVLTVIAFFAILLTGRYPRSIFDFNVGVLRWTWRVSFYSYSALGTDRYPPFTLGEAPGYPATLSIPYPERLSRGLVLVKWWLLAIPHYLVVGIFVGGGTYFAWRADGAAWAWGGGLIGLLVIIAAVVLLFTGRYPRSIFEFVLGLDRWALRVAAYAALMTDAYPPFRLDLGGGEPGTLAVGDEVRPAAPTARWTVGRVLLLVFGSLAALVSVALLAAGGAVLWADQAQREDGFVMSPTRAFSTQTYALVSDAADVDLGGDWNLAEEFLGTVRIAGESERTLFVGIARESDVGAYLAGIGHEVVTGFGDGSADYSLRSGSAPAADPADEGLWVASTRGSGALTLDWKVEDGSWQVVVMNADGSRGVEADLGIGAELNGLVWVAVGLLAGGALLLGGGVLMLVFGAREPRS